MKNIVLPNRLAAPYYYYDDDDDDSYDYQRQLNIHLVAFLQNSDFNWQGLGPDHRFPPKPRLQH